jgi:DNA-binding transcriptional LysR family regulator
MAEPLDWDDLRVYLALLREGTFSGAGRKLCLNATTLSRRLTQLEERLGTLLFQRTADGLVATPTGLGIATYVELMERQADLLQKHAAGHDAREEGLVRLAVTEHFAESFLIEHLGRFRESHPHIQLELVVGDRFADLARGEADLAVRFQKPGRGAPSDPKSPVEIRARRVGTLGTAVFASREYLARRGTPRDAFDVDGHDLVLPRANAAYFPGGGWFSAVEGRGRAAIRVDGVGSMKAAVAAGFGIAALVSIMAGRLDLIRLGPPDVVEEREIWLLMPGDLAGVARVRAVWDFLVTLLSSSPSLLTGVADRAPTIAGGGGAVRDEDVRIAGLET